MSVADPGAAPDRPCVLVVDDDRTVRAVAEAALGAAGFSVVTAADGEDALVLLETLRPEIILLDVLLPGIDGFALCRQLRDAPATCETPICMMTGLDDLASIQQAYESGATDFIGKPLNWVIIVQRLRYILRAGRAARDLAVANAQLQREVTVRKEVEQSERDQRRLAEALRDSAAAMNGTLELEGVLDRILDSIDRVADFDAAFLVMVEGAEARVVRHRGVAAQQAGKPGLRERYDLADLPLLKSLLATGEPRFVDDALGDPLGEAGHRLAGWTRSSFGIPLEIRGQVLGAIVLVSDAPDYFSTDAAPRLRAFASQASVAIENARLFSQVRRLSSVDGLTGLDNRRHFFEVAKVEFERTRRHGRPLSVAMIDIDFYKELNDRWGHLVGDAALREVAVRLRDSVRTIDVVARYGGDEFVVLMPETGLAEALLVAGRVCRRVAQSPVVDDGVTVATTVSVGVAEIGAQCESLEDLLKCADQALYAAKAGGRNRVEAHPGGGAR